MLLPVCVRTVCVCVTCCAVSRQIYSRFGLGDFWSVYECDGSEQVCVCVCVCVFVLLPSHPGEEFTLCLTSEGKVSQRLVALWPRIRMERESVKKRKMATLALYACLHVTSVM